MILEWVSLIAYPNLYGIRGFVVVVVVDLVLVAGESEDSRNFGILLMSSIEFT
jgi:hypothetical protein